MTLRLRVLLLVFLINAGVFGAGGLFILRAQLGENDRIAQKLARDLVYTIRVTIRPDDEVHVAHILQWPSWSALADALLVDRHLERLDSGRIQARGIALNPCGARRREPDFDEQRALGAILEAIESGRPANGIESGQVVPIQGPHGIWGGIWFRTENQVDRAALAQRILPWFLVSTVLLTAGTFLALRYLVLDPVAQLAGGAARVRSGDFGVRLEPPARRDEVADLMRSFNEMTETVGSFNRRLEEEVQAATAKARQAEAAAMTQRRLAAMGELAAGLAHEINNPLGGLSNAVEVLRARELPPAKREQYLALLAGGLERIGETVRRLRRFTPREPRDEEVELAGVARDAVELVRHRAGRLGVAIALSAPREPCVVAGAKNEIGQALLNLLSNALDAIEEHGSRDPLGPRIDVGVATEPEGFLVAVRDNGPGVSAEELTRVSDLFYTTKDVGKGTGLGLALVHNAMAKHGGSVRVDAEHGRWFLVELRFPKDGRRDGPA